MHVLWHMHTSVGHWHAPSTKTCVIWENEVGQQSNISKATLLKDLPYWLWRNHKSLSTLVVDFLHWSWFIHISLPLSGVQWPTLPFIAYNIIQGLHTSDITSAHLVSDIIQWHTTLKRPPLIDVKWEYLARNVSQYYATSAKALLHECCLWTFGKRRLPKGCNIN